MSRNVDVMFLANGEISFILRSLKDVLTRADIVTQKTDFIIKSLEEMDEIPKFFIADAETLLEHKEARVFLYDRCIENNRKVFLIGDQSSLTSLYDVTATNVIAESFKRPLDYDEIIACIKKYIADFDAKGAKKNILVVDDSPTFLRLISEWLENDYNVNVCPSATVAFHSIDMNKPDLILLDYEMPICNGAQFLQMLHSERHTEDIPVIFITSKDDADTVKSLLSLKPQGYLLKNQTKENTLNAIAGFFARENMK